MTEPVRAMWRPIWFFCWLTACATLPAAPPAETPANDQTVAEPEAEPPLTIVEAAPPSELGENPVRVSEHRFRVTRAFVDDLFKNLEASARAEPVTEDGRVTGLRVFDIGPDSPLRELGIQDGDELRAISGYQLASPEAALEAYGKLRNASEIELELVRDSAPLTFTYDIVDER